MEFLLIDKDERVDYYPQLLDMLSLADNEFVPPLSARTSTTQSRFSCSAELTGGVLEYFEELKKQNLFIATENKRVLGFVSFKENYTCNIIGENELPNIYISTLIVSAEARGQRLTQRMYEKLFDLYSHASVFTRTWSTNGAHINILSKFGFEILCTLKDDRGEGIDTVYFKKGRDNL